MENTKHLDFENEIVRYYVEHNTGILKLKNNIFESFSQLELSNQLLNFLDWVEQDNSVRSLLLLNEEEAYCEKGYYEFLNQILVRDENNDLTSKVMPEKRVLRARQMNAFRNFIVKIINFSKIVLTGIRGEVVTPFIGTNLAADFRYATPGTKFFMAHLKYGMHPAGALPFFLSRIAGPTKALELLFRTDIITAEEALEVGMINGIIPESDYESYCIGRAKLYAKYDSRMSTMTKSLTYNMKKDLDNYFAEESRLVGY